jgi:hypothetical protein
LQQVTVGKTHRIKDQYPDQVNKNRTKNVEVKEMIEAKQ